MKLVRKSILIAVVYISFFVSGCFSDLDTVPLDRDIVTSAFVFDDPESYKKVLAKLYAGLAVSGQEGPAGKPDIGGIDEGFGQYLRGLWYHQELTTDEAFIGWNDQTIANFHGQNWTSQDGFIFAFYSRIFYQISVCNEFLRQTTDEKLNERGVDGALKAEIATYRAEARFLRAFSYWHALDHFRNVPFVTENDVIGSFSPKQANAQEVFNFIESELKDIESSLKPALSNEYGRVDVAAAWLLLSKLYLNAEVYINANKSADAVTYAEKVIASGYQLNANYKHLFFGDNHSSKEIIFPIVYHGVSTQTYGGTTFIIKAGIGGSMRPSDSGVNEAWAGTRTTKEFVSKFPADLNDIVVDFNIGKTNSHPRLLMPGSFQSSPFDGTDITNSLTSPAKDDIYEGYRYLKNGDEFVFMKNASSTLKNKYGDSNGDGSLELEGGNIKVTSDGLYKLVVDWDNKTYTLSKQTWSITGNAVNNQVIPMIWNNDTKLLTLKAQLSNSDFTFVNSNNEVLGDNLNDAILEKNGAAIKVNGGGYEIRLDLDRPDYTYQIKSTDFDTRASFYAQGQSLEINDLTLFTDGYAINKFKNITSTGKAASNTAFVDTDFPLFRLADAYLIASEALLRSNGDKNKALEYFNVIRTRAYSGSAFGNYSLAEFDLEDILEERAREFYWECHRRTDLVRFGQFTNGNYVWAWKGGVKEGTQVENFRNVFPIPAADLNANTNLKQNTGY